MQQKINRTVAVLQQAVRDFSPACFANSLGAEDMVLTDMIARKRLDIEMFSLDTGRLPQETYSLMHNVENYYDIRLNVYFPDYGLVER
jgi:phosphoadenosine phosphosulfate reductase